MSRGFGASYGQEARLRYRGPSTALTPTVFMVRGGPNSAASTCTINSNGAAILYGGAALRSGPWIREWA